MTAASEAVICPQDFAEAIAQLAVFPPGREALLHDPTVTEALHQVAAAGWTNEARKHAEEALLAMSDRQPEVDHRQQGDAQKHVMLSYQWTYQATVQRTNQSLIARGYATWFDLTNMKGSTMDAMSDAIEGADVMLYLSLIHI